jgi:2-iminoacetate synthase ThiH
MTFGKYPRISATSGPMLASSFRHGTTTAQHERHASSIGLEPADNILPLTGFSGRAQVQRASAQRISFAEPGTNSFTFAVTINGFAKPGELLHCRGEEQERLHAHAAEAVRGRFGRRVFLRGVVEVSNYCRENCVYCGMRRENQSLARFRARLDQLSELLIHHRPASITDLNIQTGEDPVAVREIVIPLIQRIREHTPLGVSVCLGTLSSALYEELQSAGASIYIMKFEIADGGFYKRMSAPGNFSERLEHIRLLASKGWKVSSGFIAGLPEQDTDDVLDNLELARQLPLVGCSVSPFSFPGKRPPCTTLPPATSTSPSTPWPSCA